MLSTKDVPHLIDAHCHLDFEAFDEDRDQVLKRAEDNKITDIIIPGTQNKFWNRINTLCSAHKKKSNTIRLHPCYGLHPYWVHNHEQNDLKHLERYLDKNKPVALGECGLDFRPQYINQNRADKKTQTMFFEAQLDIANNQQLPVVVHSVNATEAVMQSIKKFNNITGMIHSYSGSLEQAKQLIDLNFLISIGGNVTYPQAKKIRKVAGELPLNALLVETDAPDQSDHGNRARRNEPAFLINTVKEIAQLRNETEKTIAQQTTINAKKLFRL
jgi:TatD DNase family protein